MTQGIRPVLPPVALTVRYTVPDRRRRDRDNYGTGVSKHAVDQLVRLGILPDDDYRTIASYRTEIVYEKGVRRLEVELRPCDGED